MSPFARLTTFVALRRTTDLWVRSSLCELELTSNSPSGMTSFDSVILRMRLLRFGMATVPVPTVATTSANSVRTLGTRFSKAVAFKAPAFGFAYAAA